MSYKEDVYEDLKSEFAYGDYDYILNQYLLENGNVDWSSDRLREALIDSAMVDDSVTGNASGSYYFDSTKAKNQVLANLDEVREAFEELDAMAQLGEYFVDEEWESMDVWARCNQVYYAVEKIMGEMKEKYDGVWN